MKVILKLNKYLHIILISILSISDIKKLKFDSVKTYINLFICIFYFAWLNDKILII